MVIKDINISLHNLEYSFIYKFSFIALLIMISTNWFWFNNNWEILFIVIILLFSNILDNSFNIIS